MRHLPLVMRGICYATSPLSDEMNLLRDIPLGDEKNLLGDIAP